VYLDRCSLHYSKYIFYDLLPLSSKINNYILAYANSKGPHFIAQSKAATVCYGIIMFGLLQHLKITKCGYLKISYIACKRKYYKCKKNLKFSVLVGTALKSTETSS